MTCPECGEEVPGQLSEAYGCCDHCVGVMDAIERGGPYLGTTSADRPALNEELATRFAK